MDNGVVLGTVNGILLGNNGGRALGTALDPCVSDAITTSYTGASLENLSALKIEFTNDATSALAIFDAKA